MIQLNLVNNDRAAMLLMIEHLRVLEERIRIDLERITRELDAARDHSETSMSDACEMRGFTSN